MPHSISGSGYSPTAQPTSMAMIIPGTIPKLAILRAREFSLITFLNERENKI